MMENIPFWASLCLTFIGITIAVGNGTVFVVYCSNKQLRTMTNYFVLSLAVSDFLVGTVLLPLRVWSPESQALGPLIAFTLIASLSNISGCTYDRYIAIHRPLRYHSILTKKKVHKIIVAIWLVPLVVAIIPQIWLSPAVGIRPHIISRVQRVYVALMSFGVLITCLVLIGIYISVFCVAKRHFEAIAYLNSFADQRRHQEQNGSRPNMKSRRFSLKSLVKDVKATKLVAMIGAAFTICWLPLIIINIFESIGCFELLPIDFVTVALFTIFCNSLGNPAIYAFFQREFRVAVSSYVRKIFKRNEARSFQTSLTSNSHQEHESFCNTGEERNSIALNSLESENLPQSAVRQAGSNKAKHHSVVSFVGQCP